MKTKKQNIGDYGEFVSKHNDELDGYETGNTKRNNKGYDYPRIERKKQLKNAINKLW